MKLYVIKINEQGSFVAADTIPKRSALGIVRSPGQRFRVPSIIRAAEQTNNPEVVDAANALVDDIQAEMDAEGYATIDWAEPTETPATFRVGNQMFESKHKWAEYNMDALDKALMAFMELPEGEGGTGGGNQGGGGKVGGNRSGGRGNRSTRGANLGG